MYLRCKYGLAVAGAALAWRWRVLPARSVPLLALLGTMAGRTVRALAVYAKSPARVWACRALRWSGVFSSFWRAICSALRSFGHCAPVRCDAWFFFAWWNYSARRIGSASWSGRSSPLFSFRPAALLCVAPCCLGLGLGGR